MLRKNREEMLKLKAGKGKSVIPHGEYCYGGGVDDSGMPCIKICPYWDCDNELGRQNNGYCWFLEEGDWETNETAQLIDLKTGEVVCAKDLPIPIGLLWDQCKECGINGYDEEDLSDRNDQIGINIGVSGSENGVSINPCD